MPEIQFSVPAGQFTRWTQKAADSLIGKTFQANEFDTLNVGKGKVLAAKIEEEGKVLILTVDWPTDTPLAINSTNFSIGEIAS